MLFRSEDHKCIECPYMITRPIPASYQCNAPWTGKTVLWHWVVQNGEVIMPDRQEWCPLLVGTVQCGGRAV